MREGTLGCIKIVLYHLVRETSAIILLNSLNLATHGGILLSSKRRGRSAAIDYFDLFNDEFSDSAFLGTASCSRLLYILLLLIVLATGVLHRQIAIFVIAEEHEWSDIALWLLVLGKAALWHVALVAAHGCVATLQLSLLCQVG